jgi:hypothetical protein
MSKTSRSYKQIAKPLEHVTDLCSKCEENGKARKVYPGYPHCWSHMKRSDRAIARKHDALKGVVSGKFGFYTRHLSKTLQTLAAEAERAGDLSSLYTTELSEELFTSRLLLMQWLKEHSEDKDFPLKDVLDCVQIISRIARTSKTISDSDEGALKEEFLRAILEAITHAFHKANLGRTPEARATAFVDEVGKIFRGGTKQFDTPALQTAEDAVPAGVDGD